ncbi:GntR family transcriptional regulator [Actinoplanes oblitus]|uniref:GntR family transcriptional regulator n=1 Tax=Actinoplanes oblitus TaxID=3040509 RepID=A0ABY8WJF9_9ACTN|nr:GntR family transcriptional regulator [Actinoplanes oblitus]WIM96479.1 GntR family transcriptional regulator [Actinoplanes oblitus]
MTAVPDDGRRSRQRQLAGDLRALILAGDIGPHQRLPSTAELTRRYAVTNMTVTRALRILKAEGLVTGHQGRSVTATGRRPATVFAGTRHGSARLLDVGEVPAPAPVARVFGLEPDEPVVVRHQLRLLDAEPAELSWTYYPAALARGTALAEPDPLPDGSPALLATLGHPLRHATDQVSVRPATVAEFIALRLPEDIPVLRQFRVGYTDGDRPVEVTVMIKAGQQFEIRYEVPVSG